LIGTKASATSDTLPSDFQVVGSARAVPSGDAVYSDLRKVRWPLTSAYDAPST
jgi:hypothetical protein